MDNLRTEMPAMQEPDVSDWLTPREIQHELRIGERLCYRLLRTGAVPSVRVGKLYRVRREALDELREKAMSA